MQALDQSIADQLKCIRTEITALQAGRPEITLVAVSKKKPVSAILAALALEQYHFGENYLQEGLEKIRFFRQLQYQNQNLNWHYLGQIQTNKIAKIVAYFDVVHSLGSLKHAQLMAECAEAQGKIMPVFLQVNFQEEDSKSGFSRQTLEACLSELSHLAHLKLMGLMLIPKPASASLQQKLFYEFQAYRKQLEACYKVELPHLSMGMSGDFKAAILAGADFVRIGTGIFGVR